MGKNHKIFLSTYRAVYIFQTAILKYPTIKHTALCKSSDINLINPLNIPSGDGKYCFDCNGNGFVS